ncbi:protease PrsW [Marinilabiliaceae bacterium JC017]|nr:protease PrsW [Marinilabiliaceae bacterium JC017]
MNLLIIAVAPVFIILAYIYYRDKYEKEPFALLIRGLVAGMLITVPVIFTEQLVDATITPHFNTKISKAFSSAFLMAALCEEGFKYLAVFLLIWKNKNFNERFDGIVYAVFVSLGFALVENIMYVFSNGMQVGLSRAFTAVPAHAIFGILMGYHLGLARFLPASRPFHLFNAFFFPFLFHGLYDFILMSQHPILLVCFAPFLVYMWMRAKKRLQAHSEASVFKDKPMNNQ